MTDLLKAIAVVSLLALALFSLCVFAPKTARQMLDSWEDMTGH